MEHLIFAVPFFSGQSHNFGTTNYFRLHEAYIVARSYKAHISPLYSNRTPREWFQVLLTDVNSDKTVDTFYLLFFEAFPPFPCSLNDLVSNRKYH